jgi:hypothetical protein
MGDCRIQQVTAEFIFAHGYLGASFRLVITPPSEIVLHDSHRRIPLGTVAGGRYVYKYLYTHIVPCCLAGRGGWLRKTLLAVNRVMRVKHPAPNFSPCRVSTRLPRHLFLLPPPLKVGAMISGSKVGAAAAQGAAVFAPQHYQCPLGGAAAKVKLVQKLPVPATCELMPMRKLPVPATCELTSVQSILPRSAHRAHHPPTWTWSHKNKRRLDAWVESCGK